jgi:2-dehydropantoate 2-reductase
MIVPLLNGMRHIELLVARFSERAVLGGVSAAVASLEADGTIAVARGSQAMIRYGERAGGISPRVAAHHDGHVRSGSCSPRAARSTR